MNVGKRKTSRLTSKMKHSILFYCALEEFAGNPTNAIVLSNFTKTSNDYVNFIKYKRFHTRIPDFFEVWIPQYLSYDFYSHFRMTRTTSEKLLIELKNILHEKVYRGGLEPIPSEKAMLATLWYLAKGETIISVADRFNISLSSAHSIINNVVSAMNKLLKKYIVWPSHNECFTIAQQFFEASGYPDVIGAIDGCHVTCKIPYEQHDSYQDRKFNHSITIQAACTTERIFTHISVGYPGAIHDARILQESSIGKITRDNADTLFYTRFHLVGDSAYPCKTWLMSPFRDNGRLTQQQKKHNYALSRARVVIENVFGLLKGRWRILNFVNVYSIEKAVKIITCCCILHNFCLINHDDFDAANNFEREHRGNYEEQVVDDNGAQKRMTICDMF